jgi:hypothetical protein
MINFNENDMKVIVKALLNLPAGESYDVLKKIDQASKSEAIPEVEAEPAF